MVPGLGAQTQILVTGDQFWIQDLELGLGSQDLETRTYCFQCLTRHGGIKRTQEGCGHLRGQIHKDLWCTSLGMVSNDG